MFEIVVASGKGGTGKTSVTAALGVVAGSQATMADCDVDAANLHLLYEPTIQSRHEFWCGKTAEIVAAECSACGVCQEHCRYEAIHRVVPNGVTDGGADGGYFVDPMSCEGCALCHHLCPHDAIVMNDMLAGEWFVSKSRFAHWFVHAALGVGQEASGKLVSKVKDEARAIAKREQGPFVVVDGPPGVGCPAIAALSGADHVLIVTEATSSGSHDLERVVELVHRFETKASCLINKCDLNEDAASAIESYCATHDVDVVGRIPYTDVFLDALYDGRTLMETNDSVVKESIIEIWDYLKRSKRDDEHSIPSNRS